MEAFRSVDEIIDFAIGQEEEAARFYTDLAQRMDKPWMREALKNYANEELGHKAKLVAIKEGRLLQPSEQRILDLKLAESMVEVEASPDMDYQAALTVAMQREKAAFKMYNDLASVTEDANVRATLLALAQEEAKHKLRFEVEYDERVLTEN
jgi:rubrerythrin